MKDVFNRFLEAHGVDPVAFWRAHQAPDVDMWLWVTSAFPWPWTETTPPYGIESSTSRANVDFWNGLNEAWKVEIQKTGAAKNGEKTNARSF